MPHSIGAKRRCIRPAKDSFLCASVADDPSRSQSYLLRFAPRLFAAGLSIFLIHGRAADAQVIASNPQSMAAFTTQNVTMGFTLPAASAGEVLVVEVADRQTANQTYYETGASNVPPAVGTASTWLSATGTGFGTGGTKLLFAADSFSLISALAVWRQTAIYYLPLSASDSGTVTIAGAIPDGADVSNSWISAAILSNVNTSTAPIVTPINTNLSNSAGSTITGSASLAGVTAGSAAVMDLVVGNGAGTITSMSGPTGTSGTSTNANIVTQTNVNATTVGMGYLTGLTAGTDAFTAAGNTGATTKIPFSVAVFTANSPVAWTGGTGTDQNWSDGANWSGGAAPSSAAGSTIGGFALFNAAYTNPGINIPIVVDSGRNVFGITFDTGALASMLIGSSNGNSLLLTSAGSIQTTSTVGSAQSVNAPLVLEGAGGTYAFTSGSTNSAATLNFGGAISGGAAGATVLTLNGVNTGANTISGAISNGSATSLALNVFGGTWVLANANNTYSGATTVQTGTLRVTGTITASAITVGGTSAGGASGSPTLAGSGTIGGPVSVFGSGTGNVAGHLAPSSFTGTSGSTLNLSGALTLNTGSDLDFDLSNSTSGSNDEINITGSGAVNYGTGGVLNIKASNGTLAQGTYVLINNASSGTLSGGAAWTIGTNTAANTGVLYTISNTGKNLDLNVFAGVTWGGQTNSAWDTGTTNWFSGSTGTTFTTGFAASFGDKQYSAGPPVTQNSITISGSVGESPSAVLFSNTAAGVANYTITSSDSANQGITGSASITLSGSGSVTLIGTNTYTGATAINAGALNIQSSGALGATSAIVVASGAALQLQGGAGSLTIGNLPLAVSGTGLAASPAGALDNISGTNTFAGLVTLGANTTIQSDSGSLALTNTGTITGSGFNLTLAGAAGGSIASAIGTGTGSLAKTGAGAWTLSGTNTYTGLTLIAQGTLNIPTGGTTTFRGVGTASSVVGNTANQVAVLQISGGTVNDNDANVGLQVATAAGSQGFIEMTGGTLAVTAGGRLRLADVSVVAPAEFAAFTLTAGTVSTTSSFALSNGANEFAVFNQTSGSVTAATGGNATYVGNNGGTGVMSLSGGTFTSTQGGVFIGGSATSTGNAVGTLNVSSTAVLTVGSAAGLTIGSLAGSTGTMNLLGGTITASVVVGGPGTGTFNFNGGTLKASAATTTFMTGITNAYVLSGGGTVDNAAHAITIGQALLTPTGNGVSATGLAITGGSGYIDTPIVTVTGGGGSGATAVAVVSGGAITGITITNPGIGYTSVPTFTLTGGGGTGASISAGTAQVVPNVSGGMTFTDSGAAAVTALTGASTYTGPTLISAGTLQLGNGGTTGALSTSSVITDNGTFAVNRSNAAAQGTDFSGSPLTGSGGLTQLGAGTLTLTAVNGYTGPTTVLRGTLRLSGGASLASGSAVAVGGTLAAGAGGSPTLAGAGTVNGPVAVLGIAPGNVPGHLAPSSFTGATGTTLNLAGALTFNSGAALDFNLNNSTGSGNDLVSVSGSGVVSYGAGGLLNINAYNGPLAQGTYTLVNDSSSASSTGGTGWAIGTNNDPNRVTTGYIISASGNNLVLTVSPATTWGGQTSSAWDTSTLNWYVSSAATTFSAGAPVAFNDTQFSGGPTVTNSSVTVGVSGGVSPGSVTFNNSSVAYTITSNDATNQGITGTTGLTVAGSGKVTLVGVNTYTGPTQLDAGTLVISQNRSLGTASAPLTFNGGTLQYAAGTPTATADISSHAVTFNSPGATIDINGNTIAYAAGIGNGGTGHLTIASTAGGGMLNLLGADSYSGGTSITGGTVIGVSSSALGSSASLSVASGAAFDYEPTAAGALALGAGTLTLAGGSTIGAAIGGTASQSAITSSAAASVTGLIAVNVYGIPGVAVTAGTNNLITAASGLNGGAYTYKVYNATNFTVTSESQSPTAISATVATAAALTSEFWKGGFSGGNNVWALSDGTANSNWATAQAGGATSLVPGTAATVTFSATGAVNQGGMVLGANMSIGGIVDNDTNPINLNADGNVLALGGSGITLNPGSAAVTLASFVKLGSNQTWALNSTSLLTISGNLLGSAQLVVAAGSSRNNSSFGVTTNVTTLVLTGNNSAYSGSIILAPATAANSWAITVLSAQSPNALGTGNLSLLNAVNTVNGNAPAAITGATVTTGATGILEIGAKLNYGAW